ncbi:hypothetical protein SVAN01_10020 [Stagonosporopsis vannaccii]|nr:hypothetical protein SVAN01_10020 [Stagonosporopsis vannaccii]
MSNSLHLQAESSESKLRDTTMSFLDTADLPRSSLLCDPSRRYRGLSYNCSYTPPIPESRPLPPKRDSAVGLNMRCAKDTITATTIFICVGTSTSILAPSTTALNAATVVSRTVNVAPGQAKEPQAQ